MATILNSAILDSAICTKKTSLIHSHSNWWLQPSWILLSWIQPFAQKNFTCSFWLNLMMAAILNSAMLDSDTAILDSNTLLSQIHSKHSPSTLTLTQTNWIWLTRWWQPSWILPSWIQPFAQKKLHSFNLTEIHDCSHLEFCHLGFSHLHTKNFTCSFWLNLMMAAILNSAMLDSDTANLDSNTLLSSLRFTQKHSSSTLTLTQTNSIWLT